ncbi:MAG: FAD-dependent oxidoreductase [SAR324 cluster bacterium]
MPAPPDSAPPLLLSPLGLGRVSLPNRIVFGAHLTNFRALARGSNSTVRALVRGSNSTVRALARGSNSTVRAIAQGTDGTVGRCNCFSERHYAYYRERAAGGAGLIVTEALTVHPLDWPYEHVPFGHADAILPSLTELRDAVRAANPATLLVAQLNHTGGQCSGRLLRQSPWAPSTMTDVASKRMAREMLAEEVHQAIAGFAAAAGRVTRAGLDGVELNAGQWSLIRQFLSALTNQRQDEYGGDPERRMRFLLDTVRAVRETLGARPLLGVKLCGDELAPWGGLTPRDAEGVAVRLARLGGVDYLSVEVGGPYSTHITDAAMPTPQGHAAHLAEGVRAALRAAGFSLPVFAEGRIESPAVAERILSEGQADAVVMTRALLSDPRLPRKLSAAARIAGASQDASGPALSERLREESAAPPERLREESASPPERLREKPSQQPVARASGGDSEPIRPHVGNTRYYSVRGDWNRPVGDLANPRAGREAILPAAVPLGEARGRRMLVIGGGPAGCEAGLTLARQGWTVTLADGRAQLGGWAALLGAALPARAEYAPLARYYEAMLQRLAVDVRLNTTLSGSEAELAGQPVEKYVRIYVATGARSPVPALEVEDAACRVITARELLDDPPASLPAPGRAAVVDSEYGFRMANAVEYLLARGFAVDVVSPDLFVGRELVESGEFLWFQRVASAQVSGAPAVTLRPRLQARALRGHALFCTGRFSETELPLGPLALVVLAQPELPDTSVYENLAARHPAVIRIGDARAPRLMGEAILNAHRAVVLGQTS